MSAAAGHGATVFDYLRRAYPMPVTSYEIMTATGLSYSQVRSGLRHIVHHLGLLHDEPLIYRAYSVWRPATSSYVRSWYKLGETVKEVKDYGAVAFGGEVKRLFGIAKRLEAGASKFGVDMDPLLRTIRRAAEDVEYVQRKLLV